ncbi:MAG: DUF4407 domain-containing protein [Oscillospiraceae bacterium]|nr:DUF4407 domain-containing protein [Oscillospiraceae bacterium]
MSPKNSTTDTKPTIIKRAGWLNEFLWSCAGVNKPILRRCPSDYAKYAGIGGTILFTALMACFSGGYALSFVFGEWWIGIIFGIFWGLLIFNLDRFIVNTMYSDGKVTISWQELKSGLPRIIMAIFLGIVISYPLELKIFDDEIQVKIEEMKSDRLRDYIAIDQKRVDSLEQVLSHLRETPVSIYDVDITGGNAQLNSLMEKQKELKANIDHENSLIVNLEREIYNLKLNNNDGKNDGLINKKTASKRASQSKRNAFQTELRNVQAEMAVISPQVQELIKKKTLDRETNIKSLQSDIDILKRKIANADKEYKRILDKNFNGFQAQMLAFSEMKQSKLEDELVSSTQIASWLIMLLFIIIETAPTFFKMMMEDGPYDDLLRAEMHKATVLADKSISDVNDAVNTCVRISTMKNEKRLEAETIANADIMAKIARAQAELLETAIAGWKETELEKIRQNPSAYVVSLVPPKQEMEVVADEEGNLSEFHHNRSKVYTHTSNEHIERSGAINLQMTPTEIVEHANEAPEVLITEEEVLSKENLNEREETRPSFWKRLFGRKS